MRTRQWRSRLRLALLFTVYSVAPTTDALAQSVLQDVGCAQERALHSIDGTVATHVTFVNRGAATMRTYWLNYQGLRVFYRDVAPGSNYVQQTFVTHPWVITNDGTGNCVAIFQPIPSDGVAIVK